MSIVFLCLCVLIFHGSLLARLPQAMVSFSWRHGLLSPQWALVGGTLQVGEHLGISLAMGVPHYGWYGWFMSWKILCSSGWFGDTPIIPYFRKPELLFESCRYNCYLYPEHCCFFPSLSLGSSNWWSSDILRSKVTSSDFTGPKVSQR